METDALPLGISLTLDQVDATVVVIALGRRLEASVVTVTNPDKGTHTLRTPSAGKSAPSDVQKLVLIPIAQHCHACSHIRTSWDVLCGFDEMSRHVPCSRARLAEREAPHSPGLASLRSAGQVGNAVSATLRQLQPADDPRVGVAGPRWSRLG